MSRLGLQLMAGRLRNLVLPRCPLPRPRLRRSAREPPRGIIATVVDVPGVTATAETRSEVLNLIRELLAPFWKPSELD